MAAGYAERPYADPDQREEFKRQVELLKSDMAQNISNRPGPRRDDTPDHHTVGSMVNLLNNDMAQLVNEICELREKLTPIRADRVQEKQTALGKPVSCRVAAELADVHAKLEEARRAVYAISAEIDL